MKFEVDPEHELYSNECHYDIRERCVSRREKFPTAVHVSEKVSTDGQCKSRALQNPVVSRYGFTWIAIRFLVRTCNGTCHLLLDNPNTIPIGKRKPHTVACKNI